MKNIFKFFAYIAFFACAVYGICCLIDKYVSKYSGISEEECDSDCICTQIIKKLAGNFKKEVSKLQKPAAEDDLQD